LAESLGHLSVGDIVNLVITRPKQQSLHDARHVTGDTPASFRRCGVMRVLRSSDAILELSMTARTHPVGLIAKLQRRWVGSGIVGMRIVAGSAAQRRFLETPRSLEGLHHKRCLPK